VHPYTRSLLSAIPHPNPRLEKNRPVFTYDYKSSGLDYARGAYHDLGGTHRVLGDDRDLETWLREAPGD
jgi:oligopeptide transport system ATP-binding protein